MKIYQKHRLHFISSIESGSYNRLINGRVHAKRSMYANERKKERRNKIENKTQSHIQNHLDKLRNDSNANINQRKMNSFEMNYYIIDRFLFLKTRMMDRTQTMMMMKMKTETEVVKIEPTHPSITMELI